MGRSLNIFKTITSDIHIRAACDAREARARCPLLLLLAIDGVYIRHG